MHNKTFSHSITIGEVEFKVMGSYNPEYDEHNPLVIEYDEILALVMTEGEMVEVDGKVLLDSFNAWDEFESKVIDIVESEEDEEDDEDDDEEEDIIEPERYTEFDETEDEY